MKRKLPSWLNEQADAEADREDDRHDAGDNATGEEEEADYLNMPLETDKHTSSSLLSKHDRDRLKRQDAGRVRQPTVEEKADAAREEGLAKPLDADPKHSKAMRMMTMMGYKAGTALGVQENFEKNALKEPLAPSVMLARGGLGLAAEQKRQFLAGLQEEEAVEHATKEGYRDAVRSERETRRMEGQLHAAQGICERLDMEALGVEDVEQMKEMNVLWRGRIRHRKQKERERAFKQQLLDHALTFGDRRYNDEDALEHVNKQTSTEDEEQADARRKRLRATLEEEGEEEEDAELDAFEQLDVADALEQVLSHLRSEHFYCFWCGHRYTSASELSSLCPGPLEEDH